MKRTISILLMACLLLPLVPAKARAQLNFNSLNSIAPVQSASQANLDSSVVPRPIISEDYMLGAGDQLEAHLIVGDNALVMDYTFVINPEGKIFFPNVSEMSLAGLTLKDARSEMIAGIRKKYREKFDLSLMVAVPKQINIYVTGQVDGPGLRTVFDGTRISQILKSTGVAKGGSDLSEYVFLKRQTTNGKFDEYRFKLYDIYLSNNAEYDMALMNGDIIAVPAIKSYVYIYGEVGRSGTFGYVQGQTLSDYINLAGGPSARANLSNVTVTRQEDGRPKVYRVNASQILHRGETDKDIEIIAGDVINVPGNFFYFSDFASLANTLILALTLYTAVAGR